MTAPIMIVIPVYILARRLGIVDTHTALVLSYSSFCLPFSLWLLRAFFQSIPVGLEEAAHMDGAGRARAVVYVVAPLALPGLIATSIFTFFTFTLAWNDYIFTRILIASDELKTLPVGVQDLFSAAVVDWGLVMAAGVLITIPALAFFMAVQRHFGGRVGQRRPQGLTPPAVAGWRGSRTRVA
jgi:multiple sugar transport system permease protein